MLFYLQTLLSTFRGWLSTTCVTYRRKYDRDEGGEVGTNVQHRPFGAQEKISWAFFSILVPFQPPSSHSLSQRTCNPFARWQQWWLASPVFACIFCVKGVEYQGKCYWVLLVVWSVQTPARYQPMWHGAWYKTSAQGHASPTSSPVLSTHFQHISTRIFQ